MTVSAILKGHIDKQGKQSIYIRIANGPKRKYLKTQIKIPPKEFDKGRVKNSFSNARAFNEIIRNLILEHEFGQLNTTKYPDADFYNYCIECFNQWDRIKASETLRQYRSEINLLKHFAPSIKLSSVTPEWLNRYKQHCFALKKSINTVHKNLKFLRLIIRKAHKERLIEQNPFDVFEMPKYRNPEKKYLTADQVQRIENINPELQEEIKFCAAWFVIGCLTGLRFSDMHSFDFEKHIINNRIVLYTRKTGTPVSMPISDRLESLFERVGHKGLHLTNQHYNRVLKLVSKVCDVPTLSAHTSRHTAAVSWANAGISQEVTAKLLGHEDLKSTAIYYKITSTRIDEELQKLK